MGPVLQLSSHHSNDQSIAECAAIAVHRSSLMDKSAIHTNLSTSFVNLGALIRHLRRLQFVGSIKVELTAAEGDIIFARSGRLHVVQYNHVTGDISEGRAALRSLLLRCREPNGRIHVYRSSGREAATDTYIDETIIVRARRMAGNHT
jgi:hypothetical protein